jgi:hypothetical protein
MLAGMASIVLAIVLSAASVRADVVGPPPESCPPASRPESSHAGALCVPTDDCATDAECGVASACTPLAQCVETRPCGGRGEPDAASCTIDTVVGPCGAGSTCTTGECRPRRVCLPPTADSDGCGCDASISGGGLAALGLVIGAVSFRRKRARRS